MLSTTFLLSKTFLLTQFPSPLQPMLSTTTFLLSKTFFLSQFSPLCSPCFQLHSFNQKHSFYHNFPPPLQPMLSTTTFLLSKHYFYHNFPPLCSPQHSRHTFAFVRPYLTSFYPNFPPPLQPMLSTTFLLSKTFLLSQFSPPSAAHNIADTHLPLCDPTWLPFIKIFPPLCSPCFQLQHSFYQKHSFYHNFPPPSAAHNIADTHLPLCDPTWLSFINILPPLCSPCFQLHSFYQKHSFYHNFPPLCSPQHSRHTFAFVRPYLTSFYQNFPPPLQSMLSTTTFLLSNTFILSKFSPPSAAHAFNYNIPFIKNIPFITIFPPLCSPQHSRHTFAFVRPYLTSFYQNFPPPLQPMLSTTTFLLTKTFLLSQFSPPLQPMLSTTFLLSKFSPQNCCTCHSAAHAFNDSGYYGSSPNFLIHVQRRTEVGSHNTPYRPLYPE